MVDERLHEHPSTSDAIARMVGLATSQPATILTRRQRA
jgi:hypothetical protein